MGVGRDDRYGPVTLGRELLIRSYALKDRENGAKNASVLVNAAAITFMWGVIDPLASEYPIDGVAFGRADALMWFGIATSILLPLKGVLDSDDMPTRPDILLKTSDPESLAVASNQFVLVGDYQKAGRCAEEYAELLKIDGAVSQSKTQFNRAADFFAKAGDAGRSKAATGRSDATSRLDNPFFRVAVRSGQATTICGSRQFSELRDMLRLG